MNDIKINRPYNPRYPPRPRARSSEISHNISQVSLNPFFSLKHACTEKKRPTTRLRHLSLIYRRIENLGVSAEKFLVRFPDGTRVYLELPQLRSGVSIMRTNYDPASP